MAILNNYKPVNFKLMDKFVSNWAASQNALKYLNATYTKGSEKHNELMPSLERIAKCIDMLVSGDIKIILDVNEFKSKKENEKDLELNNRIRLFESTCVDIRKKFYQIFSNSRFMDFNLNRTTLNGSSIGACSCCSKMELTARKSYAETIFSIAEASYPSNEEITICSIGAGHCLQELLIHLEFSNNNKKVSWILIEPKFETLNSTEYKAAMQFKQIMEFLSSGTSVDMQPKGINEFINEICPLEPSDNLENRIPNPKIPDLFISVDLGDEIERSLSDFQSRFSKIATPPLFITISQNGELKF